MKCPFCGSEKNSVIRTVSLMQVSRVRQCHECKRVFQTTESVDSEFKAFARVLEVRVAEPAEVHA